MKFKQVIQRAEYEARDLDRKLVRDESIFDQAERELEVISHIQHPEPLAHDEHGEHMALKREKIAKERARYAKLKSKVEEARARLARVNEEEQSELVLLDAKLDRSIDALEETAAYYQQALASLERRAAAARSEYDARKYRITYDAGRERERREKELISRQNDAEDVIKNFELADARWK